MSEERSRIWFTGASLKLTGFGIVDNPKYCIFALLFEEKVFAKGWLDFSKKSSFAKFRTYVGQKT
jgi:hypothetical protein